MDKRTLHIKNMVCKRCIKVVQDELENIGVEIDSIELGCVIVKEEIPENKLPAIRNLLYDNGFELIDDKKGRLIEKIKTIIIDDIHYSSQTDKQYNSSKFLAEKTGYDYSYISKLFSAVEGITIEKYIIRQKVEKVKELLVYDELSIKEIAFQLGYSSTQHLSNQFKKVTGLSPSHFKSLKIHKRKPLDEV